MPASSSRAQPLAESTPSRSRHAPPPSIGRDPDAPRPRAVPQPPRSVRRPGQTDEGRSADAMRQRADRATTERPNVHVEPLAELTTTGGALAALVPVSLAAVIDVEISPGLGLLFAFVFILSSVLVALRISWRDAWAAVAFPPLIFIAAAGIAAQVSSVSTGTWLQRTSGEMATAVLGHPFALLIGTALAAGGVVYRAHTE